MSHTFQRAIGKPMSSMLVAVALAVPSLVLAEKAYLEITLNPEVRIYSAN